MADTHVVYVANEDYVRRELCFTCAVKLAVVTDPDEVDISLQTTDYGSTNCSECGKFLIDRVEI